MTIKSLSQSQYRILPNSRKYVNYIPEEGIFKFKYKLLKGNARRQLRSYLKRMELQKAMRRVYIFEINKLILNEALTSIIKLLNFKF